MTAREEITLSCDARNCSAEFTLRSGYGQTIEYVREVAALDGWTTGAQVGSLPDMCPEHRQVAVACASQPTASDKIVDLMSALAKSVENERAHRKTTP